MPEIFLLAGFSGIANLTFDHRFAMLSQAYYRLWVKSLKSLTTPFIFISMPEVNQLWEVSFNVEVTFVRMNREVQ